MQALVDQIPLGYTLGSRWACTEGHSHRYHVCRSPALRSAVSDIEVDNVPLEKCTLRTVPGWHEPVPFGVMYHIAYKVAPRADANGKMPPAGECGEVIIATTRPETMIGDVAVAVHPDDPRYAHLHRVARVINPATGAAMPVVVDATLVDPTLGTGVVKITPAHDPNVMARACLWHGCLSRMCMACAWRIHFGANGSREQLACGGQDKCMSSNGNADADVKMLLCVTMFVDM